MMCFHSLIMNFTELLSILLLDDFILSENLIVTALQLIYDRSTELTESDYKHFCH